MKKLLLMALVLAVSAGVATAHEFFIKSVDVKDNTVSLNVLSTHYFMIGEELEPADLNEVYVLQNGKKTDLALKANEADLVYDTSFTLNGSFPALVVGHRKGMLYSTTTRGGQDGSRKELTAKGFTVLKTTWYEKFAKTYINPSKTDKTFAEPVGQTLEIIPVTNPADMEKGKPATFKVLYNGEPVKVSVNATYDGFNSKDEEAYALRTETKDDGTVAITPSASGLWLVQASLTAASESGEYDEVSLRSIVVFTVN